MTVIYDPKKIYLFANRMYSLAMVSEIFGAVLGLFCIFVAWFLTHEAPTMFSSFNARENAGLTWEVAIIIALMAILAGHARAESLRAQAQLLLCQMEVERNTANFVHQAICAEPTEPAPAQQPLQQPVQPATEEEIPTATA